VDLTASQKQTIQHQFDSFCKSVLRNAAKNYMRTIRRRIECESCFSELSEKDLSQLHIYDEYNESNHHFEIDGTDVEITEDSLFCALMKLPDKKRTIVLLAGCLGKSDVEIAEKLNMVSRTVQYHRKNSMAKLREYIGETNGSK
jgi:RNA polymerase sigma factor (sigma-70 family)